MAEKVPRAIVPLKPGLVQSDAPHTGEADLVLAQQTQAIAFRAMGNYAHEAYPNMDIVNVGYVPKATIAAVSTWYDFEFVHASAGTFSAQWPFRLTESYSRIGAMVTLITDQCSSVRLQLQTKTLAGLTVSTTTGPSDTVRPMPIYSPDIPSIIDTGHSGNGLYSGSTTLWVDSPSLEATRRFVVVLQAQAASTVDPVISLGNDVVVWLKNIVLFESVGGDVGE